MLEFLPIELHRHRRIAAGNRRIALVEQCKRLVAIQLRQLLTNPRGVATAPLTIKRDDQIRQQRRVLRRASKFTAEHAFGELRVAVPQIDHAERVVGRSEERRGGKGCVSTCRSWWSPYH